MDFWPHCSVAELAISLEDPEMLDLKFSSLHLINFHKEDILDSYLVFYVMGRG